MRAERERMKVTDCHSVYRTGSLHKATCDFFYKKNPSTQHRALSLATIEGKGRDTKKVKRRKSKSTAPRKLQSLCCIEP